MRKEEEISFEEARKYHVDKLLNPGPEGWLVPTPSREEENLESPYGNTKPETGFRLFRSTRERTFFGVCGGLAERFDVDPSVIRIGTCILALLFPWTIAVYLIMAWILPKKFYQE